VSDIQDIRKFNTNYATGDPVALMEIVLKNKTATASYRHDSHERFSWINNSTKKCYGWITWRENSSIVDVVYIPYFQNDPTNFDKIKKALLYLKELCDAEEDPFGD
jgi:hypothetical protein